MPLELNLDKEKTAHFRFKKLNGQYLLTNDIGEYIFLSPQKFNSFITGKIEGSFSDTHRELWDKNFIRNNIDFDNLVTKFSNRNMFLSGSTSLHIVVVSLRCDHACSYCQADAQSLNMKSLDMDISTAQKVVDRIFESPNDIITIEFQGGEPLVNFKVIKFIVDYAKKKNKAANKNLTFSVVSNLTFMNNDILDFLLKNKIHLCTSLDGPEYIHNKHRVTLGKKNSYKNAVKWLNKLGQEYKKRKSSFKPAALATITKSSLLRPQEIVDDYVRLGLDGIHLRLVNNFGISNQVWDKLGYSADEFLDFYARALDYIIDLNLKGKVFRERFATIFLTKILTGRDPNYLDIRSPCGAGIGQLAYNFDGEVYTCDEGRMLGKRGDHSFRLGNVRENSHKEFIGSVVTRAMCVASCLDNLAGCSECVYKPYCGVCPLFNYTTSGSIFHKSSFLCRVHQGVLDCLFHRLENEKTKNIFYKWIGKAR